MEEVKSQNTLKINTSWEIKGSIFDVKNKMYAILTTSILKKRLEEMIAKLNELKNQDDQFLKSDIQLFKTWSLTADDFRNKRKKASDILEDYQEEINIMQTELRMREIIENNREVPINEPIKELMKNIENHLWENIMNGWSNAQGVYKISWKNLVVIEKSAGTFQYIWDLPYYYNKCIWSPNIPKVLSVLKNQEKTYLIMEQAKGRQIDTLRLEDIENIPQEHFDALVRNIYELGKVWLAIDPSKRSNFFYDWKIGFILIDLSIGKNQLSSRIFEQNLLVALVWNISHGSDNLREKIKKAISRK